MSDYQYLSQGQDDGVIVNRSDEPLAFFTGTPATQVTVTSAALTTASVVASGTTYGFSQTQANLITETLRQIRAALVAYGLIAEP